MTDVRSTPWESYQEYPVDEIKRRAALPYTPSRPGFLNEILGRPANERPFLVLVVGYPADGVQVPHIERRALDEVVTFI